MNEWRTLREILDAHAEAERDWHQARQRFAEELEAEVQNLQAKGIPLDSIHEEIGRHQLETARTKERL